MSAKADFPRPQSASLRSSGNKNSKQHRDARKRCRNCTSEYEIQHFLPITSECRHDSIVCLSCVTLHIADRLLKEDTPIITCPGGGGCKSTLKERDVKRFATQPDIERFVALRAEFSMISDFRWCANSQCGSGQIHSEGGSAPIMRCVACNQRSCVIHNLLIPPNSRCSGCVQTESEPIASSSTFALPDDEVLALIISLEDGQIFSEAEQTESEPIASSSTFTPPDDELLALIISLEDSQIFSEAEIPPETKECIVCTDELEVQHFARITPQCRHEITVCRSCVRRHITHELNDKGNFRILCPNGGGCKGVMEEKDINRFARTADYHRYQKLSVNSVVSQMSDFQWCTNPECGSGQLHYGDTPIMTCTECNQKSCVVHNFTVKPDTTCPECARKAREKEEEEAAEEERLRQLREANEQSESFIKTDTKQCPKCKTRIHKIDGCDHMTCRAPSCGYEFCWFCLADYRTIVDQGNQLHQPSCNYYA